MNKKRMPFLFRVFSLSISIPILFTDSSANASTITQEEKRISLPIREHTFLVLEQPFLPLLGQRSFSTHDDKSVEQPPIIIAKRLRMRRHSDGGATDPRGLGLPADPQTDPEDIPGIEYDEQGRPKWVRVVRVQFRLLFPNWMKVLTMRPRKEMLAGDHEPKGI
jgi:hypothetical protein